MLMLGMRDGLEAIGWKWGVDLEWKWQVYSWVSNRQGLCEFWCVLIMIVGHTLKQQKIPWGWGNVLITYTNMLSGSICLILPLMEAITLICVKLCALYLFLHRKFVGFLWGGYLLKKSLPSVYTNFLVVSVRSIGVSGGLTILLLFFHYCLYWSCLYRDIMTNILVHKLHECVNKKYLEFIENYCKPPAFCQSCPLHSLLPKIITLLSPCCNWRKQVCLCYLIYHLSIMNASLNLDFHILIIIYWCSWYWKQNQQGLLFYLKKRTKMDLIS